MSLTSSIPVLRSSDYSQSRAFFKAIGFKLAEEGGDPARFGIFHRDGATVFVDAWHGADPEPSLAWRAYFHTDDLDALAAEFRAKDLSFEGPETKVYGMREIELKDPDDNRLCFGQDAD